MICEVKHVYPTKWALVPFYVKHRGIKETSNSKGNKKSKGSYLR